MPALYVASDREGVGRTTLCTTLAKRLQREGRGVALLKPFHVGEGEPPRPPDPDVEVFRQALGREAVPQDSHPVTRRQLAYGLSKELRGSVVSLPTQPEALIVEGLWLGGEGNGLGKASASLAEELEARVVLVVGYHPLLQPAAVASARDLFGPRLLGAVINGVTRYKVREVQTTLVPALEEQGVRVLGWVPEDRTLLGSTVREVSQHLGGRFLTWEEHGDRLVERFMIGGLVLDWGVSYFGRHDSKAVILRGNRPDIGMAALRTDLACLILTGGHEPIQYLRYEAGEEGVPVILVDQDTHATAAALESLMASARFNHPRKLERYLELLDAGVDMEALYAVLQSAS